MSLPNTPKCFLPNFGSNIVSGNSSENLYRNFNMQRWDWAGLSPMLCLFSSKVSPPFFCLNRCKNLTDWVLYMEGKKVNDLPGFTGTRTPTQGSMQAPGVLAVEQRTSNITSFICQALGSKHFGLDYWVVRLRKVIQKSKVEEMAGEENVKEVMATLLPAAFSPQVIVGWHAVWVHEIFSLKYCSRENLILMYCNTILSPVPYFLILSMIIMT